MNSFLRLTRKPFFFARYPKATVADFDSVNCVIERAVFHSLDDLELAGNWLVRLSDTPDHFLRQRMAGRWRSVCRRAGHLGPGTYRLYKKLASQFGLKDDKHEWMMLTASILRIGPDSVIYRLISRGRKLVMKTGKDNARFS